MDLANSSFFSVLRQRLGQLSERQRLISENIANASTPGYRPRDLDTSAFEKALAAQSGGGGLTMARTNSMHLGSGGTSGAAKILTASDSETTIDGNAVVLEDQMAKAAQTRMDFETSVALYQKGLALIRMAIKAPGR